MNSEHNINRRSIVSGLIALGVSPKTFALETSHLPKSCRIIVSLADNTNQGLVPIPAELGNGQSPNANLYWGAMYGIYGYFRRQKDWTVKRVSALEPPILDKITLTSSKFSGNSIIAEAWDGAHQNKAIKAFFSELSKPDGADHVIFVGHNALMDLGVFLPPAIGQDSKKKTASVIACKSEQYFDAALKQRGHNPYVMTRGLMAPEAYVIEAILLSWLSGQNSTLARASSAKAYAKYQRIPEKNARWLFRARSS